MTELEKHFTSVALETCSDNERIRRLWSEISAAYSEGNRHYHNLNHLEHILTELLAIRTEIQDWKAVIFAIAYHDFVYKVTSGNNEEKSAEAARKKLGLLDVQTTCIEKCVSMILATKQHIVADESYVNYFTDADLSILGQPWEKYHAYTLNIRREYSLYPTLIYNPGRVRVIKHFLEMERIYKTGHFYAKYEVAARENLLKELNTK